MRDNETSFLIKRQTHDKPAEIKGKIFEYYHKKDSLIRKIEFASINNPLEEQILISSYLDLGLQSLSSAEQGAHQWKTQVQKKLMKMLGIN